MFEKIYICWVWISGNVISIYQNGFNKELLYVTQN